MVQAGASRLPERSVERCGGDGSDGRGWDGRPVLAAELERRRAAVAAARHSIEMEGGRVSDAAAGDLDGYAAGELTVEEWLGRVWARIAAAGGPHPGGG